MIELINNKVYYFDGIPGQVLGKEPNYYLIASIKPIFLFKILNKDKDLDLSFNKHYQNNWYDNNMLQRRYNATIDWAKFEQFNCGFIYNPHTVLSNISIIHCDHKYTVDHFTV